MDEDEQEIMNGMFMAGYHDGFASGLSWAAFAIGAVILLWVLVS